MGAIISNDMTLEEKLAAIADAVSQAERVSNGA